MSIKVYNSTVQEFCAVQSLYGRVSAIRREELRGEGSAAVWGGKGEDTSNENLPSMGEDVHH